MIAALLLAAALDVKAVLRAEPQQAAIGEPVQMTLVVEHAAGVAIRLPEKLFGDDGSWVVLDRPRIVGTPGEPAVTSASWHACSLEAGERKLPVVSFELDDAYNDSVREAIASGLRTTFTYELELRAFAWIDRTIGTTVVSTTDRYDNLTRRHTLTRTVDGRVEGHINADILDVGPTATVQASVIAPKFSVEEGATFNGPVNTERARAAGTIAKHRQQSA